MSKTEAKMPLNEFWKLVAELNWGHKADGPGKTADYNKGKKILMQRLDVAMAERFSNTFSELSAKLYKPLYSLEGMSDDSYSDFRAHIIGLGQEEFEKALANPKSQEQRAAKHQYVESFSYCIPYKDDYKMLDPTQHTERAERILKEYQAGLRDNRYEPVHDSMRFIVDVFTAVVAGELNIPSDVAAKLDVALQAIEERREFIHREGGRYEDGNAMIHNFISDTKQFLG
jgi:hypothetical protein